VRFVRAGKPLMILPDHGVTVSHISRYSANPRAARRQITATIPTAAPRRGGLST
jgi:hypothetical protein